MGKRKKSSVASTFDRVTARDIAGARPWVEGMSEPKHADGRQRVLVQDGLYVRAYPDGQLWCAALVHKGYYAGWLTLALGRPEAYYQAGHTGVRFKPTGQVQRHPRGRKPRYDTHWNEGEELEPVPAYCSFRSWVLQRVSELKARPRRRRCR